MQSHEISPHALRVADLPTKKPTRFKFRPERNECDSIAESLDLRGLKKLSFEGDVSPIGKKDWRLIAKLGATVTQSCVISLAPVTTRIDIEVSREFVRELAQPSGDEFEMPEDDSVEELGEFIDPYFIMQEALAIAVPDYPKADDARVEDSLFTEPGKDAMTDEDTKPFAGLANLLNNGRKSENEG